MATYNGEQFISQQIKSILEQSYQEFVLFINDDASTDNTYNIAVKFSKSHPDKIFVTRNQTNSGGAKHNFLSMMIKCRDDYVMLCDQDDVWFPDKIEKTLKKMKQQEQIYPDYPLLVHSDLKVVDENLNIISSSYEKYMNSNFSRTAFNQVLIQNTFAGCSAMYNRATANLLRVEPSYCVMHDWWLELVVATFGHITHIDEPTVLYRQHKNNAIGTNAKKKLNASYIKNAIHETFEQAKSLLELYENDLTDSQRDILKKYCDISNVSKMNRWLSLCKLRAFKIGILRNIALFIYV